MLNFNLLFSVLSGRNKRRHKKGFKTLCLLMVAARERESEYELPSMKGKKRKREEVTTRKKNLRVYVTKKDVEVALK